MADENKELPQFERKGQANGPRLRVRVSKERIAASVERLSAHCMIAEAIKDCAPELRAISVDIATIRLTDMRHGLRYVYLTPRVAQVALVKFDRGEVPAPFGFMLQQPAQIVSAGRSAGVSESGLAREKSEARAVADNERRNARNRKRSPAMRKKERAAAKVIAAMKKTGGKKAGVVRLRGKKSAPTVVGGKAPPHHALPGQLRGVRKFGMKSFIE